MRRPIMNPEDYSSSDDEMTTMPIFSSAGMTRSWSPFDSPVTGFASPVTGFASSKVLPPPPPPIPLFAAAPQREFFESEMDRIFRTMPAPIPLEPPKAVPKAAMAVPIAVPMAAMAPPKAVPKTAEPKTYAAVSKTVPKPQPKIIEKQERKPEPKIIEKHEERNPEPEAR
jgi:hypothetical protein